MATLPQRLKDLRKKHNLTQADLAHKLGFSRTTIANYEQNKRTPTPETLCELADFFNVSLDFLMGREKRYSPGKDKYIILFKIDVNSGEILDCSQGASIFYGYDKNEILKGNISQFSTTAKDKFLSRVKSKKIFFDKHIIARNSTLNVEIISKNTPEKEDIFFLIIIPQPTSKIINNDLINILSSIIRFVDPYSKSHGKNVAKIADKIGKKLNCKHETLKTLNIAGKIHDIGKINIPYKILNKPDKLNQSELMIVKRHPVEGYNLLKHIHFQKPVARIVLQHHERLDGSGYPEGLTEKDILLESKIIAIADVLEAMTSSKPYRKKLNINETINYLNKYSGTKFDKDIVNICKNINFTQLLNLEK
ncbi:MAG: HD domain-containing phosphohydrolase [bacterium]